MKWQAVRETYPDAWVLVEAISGHSAQGRRIVEDLAVLNTFDSSERAISAYKELHKSSPARELYVAHTRKEDLEIIERKWLGIRL